MRQEEPGLEEPQKTQSLHVVQTVLSVRQSERRIRWPQTCKTTEWQMFEKDADKMLEAMAKRALERRLQMMSTIIVSVAAERFSVEEERGAKQPYYKNQRAGKIHIRKQLKALKKQHKVVSEEWAPLAELRLMLRKRLLTLCRAKQHRWRQKERARKQTAFINNPCVHQAALRAEKSWTPSLFEEGNQPTPSQNL